MEKNGFRALRGFLRNTREEIVTVFNLGDCYDLREQLQVLLALGAGSI